MRCHDFCRETLELDCGQNTVLWRNAMNHIVGDHMFQYLQMLHVNQETLEERASHTTNLPVRLTEGVSMVYQQSIYIHTLSEPRLIWRLQNPASERRGHQFHVVCHFRIQNNWTSQLKDRHHLELYV